MASAKQHVVSVNAHIARTARCFIVQCFVCCLLVCFGENTEVKRGTTVEKKRRSAHATSQNERTTILLHLEREQRRKREERLMSANVF